MTEVKLYDTLAPAYDRFVNWHARLANELPFLERLFGEHGVRRVLDTACGTGHHAIALAQRGYQAAGADLSGPMIDQARKNAAAVRVAATFVQAGMGSLAALGQQYDAVLCLGNSLPHLLTPVAVAAAVADFAAVLRPGGVLIIQNRNFDRVWARRERFMEPQSFDEGRRQWLFIRFYDFHQETVTFNMVRLFRRNKKTPWTHEVGSTELRPVFADDLLAALNAGGLDQVRLYGDYAGTPFDRTESGDLIATAVK